MPIGFGGGMSDDYAHDYSAQDNLNKLKVLLDEVNVKGKGCTEGSTVVYVLQWLSPVICRIWNGQTMILRSISMHGLKQLRNNNEQ